MNERVKQLAELSKSFKTMIVDGKMQSVLVIDPERFAELIVAECIGVVNKTDPPGYEDYPDYRDQIEKSFRIECVTEIKKHFGVEE
jgi:hypothetical protein